LSPPLSTKRPKTATKFPGDFVKFQEISRRKNNSSRFPGFPGVLDTLKKEFHGFRGEWSHTLANSDC